MIHRNPLYPSTHASNRARDLCRARSQNCCSSSCLYPHCLFQRTCCFADFIVDMQRKQIQGICKLHVTSLKTATEGAAEMVLDTRGLIIHSVDLYENTDDSLVAPEDLNEGTVKRNESKVATELRWALSASDPILGEALHVQCPGLREAGSKAVVQVTFALTEASSAVQFLDPGLTASKKHPFLFTQCQAIHARSLCPCQVLPHLLISRSCFRQPESVAIVSTE